MIFHALTLCIMMYYPIHIDTISMGLPIVYFKGSLVEFSLSLKVVLILANSADSNEMQHYAASGSSLFARIPI